MVGFSTKSRYGLRAMIYLAKNYSNEKICPLSEIAEEENISLDYLEKIIAKLKENGLVESKRGPAGGYFLKCSPEEIKVGEILRVLEKGLAPVKCIIEEENCVREEKCDAKELWRKIKKAIDDTLDSITLADLINN